MFYHGGRINPIGGDARLKPGGARRLVNEPGMGTL
jgi:hypothetical protein